MQYTNSYKSPLGDILLACDDDGLTGLWFKGQKYFAMDLDSSAEEREHPIFKDTARWLDIYFSGKEPDFTPRLHFTATPFQAKVWNILLAVPYGRTATYGEIAQRIADAGGLPHMSARAVGGAVGRNRISLIVPCHRVIGSNGSLTGYAGGIDKKLKLLSIEKANTGRLFVSKSRV